MVVVLGQRDDVALPGQLEAATTGNPNGGAVVMRDELKQKI